MKKNNTTAFIYKPERYDGPHAIDATLAVKFSQRTVILDEWYILGGTKWSRTLFRLKHPIVYSKRGLRNLYRKIRRLFIEEKIVKC